MSNNEISFNIFCHLFVLIDVSSLSLSLSPVCLCACVEQRVVNSIKMPASIVPGLPLLTKPIAFTISPGSPRANERKQIVSFSIISNTNKLIPMTNTLQTQDRLLFLHFALHVQQAVRDTLPHKTISRSHPQIACFFFYHDTLFSTVARDLGRSLNFLGEEVVEGKYPRCHLMRKGIYRAAVLVQWEQIIGLENEFQFCAYRLRTCSVTWRNTKAPRPPVFSRLDKNDCWHQDPASV